MVGRRGDADPITKAETVEGVVEEAKLTHAVYVVVQACDRRRKQVYGTHTLQKGTPKWPRWINGCIQPATACVSCYHLRGVVTTRNLHTFEAVVHRLKKKRLNDNTHRKSCFLHHSTACVFEYRNQQQRRALHRRAAVQQ